jgi:2,4-dienoyl-CoA reductase-like NADH-dependent reductase (Old Yellow Enzyme family)
MTADVWSPLRIGPVEVRNRIMMTAMTMSYGEENILSDRHIAYYRERAKGGIGLIITEQQAGHRLSKGSFYEGCTAWEKRAIPQYAKLADAVHEFGAKQFVQLFGCGVHDKGTMIFDEWHPLWAASRVPSVVHREVPVEMEQEHIDDLVKGFGEAALNVKVAGLDGVEVSAAHSYLLGQFLSPGYNRRTDGYGGSPEKRARLPLEIAAEIRERVGSDIALGLRLSFEEWMGAAGITAEESEEQIERFAASGLFDFLNISSGGYHSIHYAAPPGSFLDEGYMVKFARRAKELVGDRLRVFTAGRIIRVEMAEEIVASGGADMVAMTRAHVADPFLVKKAREGREDETVRCVGANVCQQRLWDQRPVACVMNPTAGRERYWGDGSLVSANGSARRIAVVGGGPAGMKTAALAARRGHSVVLMEREGELGGHLRLIGRLPGRKTFGMAVEGFAAPLGKAGVEVRLGTDATREALTGEDFGTIVCATGSHWDDSGFSPYRPDRDAMPGAERDEVITVDAALERALADPRSLGERVVILDESAGFLPQALALMVAEAGGDVELVTPQLFVGEDTQKTWEMNFLYPKLHEAGVRMRPQHFIESVDDDGVDVYNVWGGPHERLAADTVVLALMRLPDEDLFLQLRDAGLPDARRVGDAIAPRRLEAVVYEGEKLGREI